MTENQRDVAKEAINRGRKLMKELAQEKVVNFTTYRDLKRSVLRMERKQKEAGR